MSKFTDQERERIMAEAREHLAWARNLPPTNVLDDFERVVRPDSEPPEPEPEPRFVTRSLDAEVNAVIAAVGADTEQMIEEHRKFVFDVVAGVIAEVQRHEAEAIAAAKKEVLAELTSAMAKVETLQIECTRLHLEVVRLSAAADAIALANGRGGAVAIMKH